jgi:hypothetical protein
MPTGSAVHILIVQVIPGTYGYCVIVESFIPPKFTPIAQYLLTESVNSNIMQRYLRK